MAKLRAILVTVPIVFLFPTKDSANETRTADRMTQRIWNPIPPSRSHTHNPLLQLPEKQTKKLIESPQHGKQITHTITETVFH